MIQKTYTLSSTDELKDLQERIHNNPAYRSAKDKVLLTWARIWEEDEFASFRQEIFRLFPDFTTIGNNNHNKDDIMNGLVDITSGSHNITLSFLFFESSYTTLLGIEPGVREEERQGRELGNCLDGMDDVKGVYLVTPDYLCSAEAVIVEALKDRDDIPLFGVKTSLHAGYSIFGYMANHEIKEHKLFALIFRGKELTLRIHYNLGWTPVGKIMTVTKEENPFFVDEIDGMPATNVYNKYLGLANVQIIPGNLSEFPLILYREGIKISRIGIAGAKEGQLIFGAPVYLNDRISLSYGNPDDLFEEIRDDCRALSDFAPQAGMLIVCSNRVMLLRERENEEITLYRKTMKSAPAVYGYGEIFYLDGKGGELNSALVSVALKEDASSDMLNSLEVTDDSDSSRDMAADPLPSLMVPFADRLSRMFKEMSADLINAVNEAEDANRAKSLFYSCISHEIRTPLNSILGMNEMILRESGDESILEYAHNIKNSGKMLLQIINDILDTEKLEAGKMEIVPVEYSIEDMIKELISMTSYSADSKGLKLNKQITGVLPPILFGDAARIRQCALNLLNNAIKYTSEGSVTLSVSVTPMVEQDNGKPSVRLHISVIDTGIGIKPEDIKKLSIPFERLDKSRNYSIEGTGLGLNIVKNLLALMGSELEIESTYGEGSVFSFSIVQESREPKNGPVHTETDDILTSDNTFRDAVILVVDDTPANIRVMELFLKKSLIRTDSAKDGRTALEMLRKKKYDIIFIDRRMPEMDGLETFKQAKEDPDGLNSGSVYVMLTADDEASEREAFINEGFDDFMSKPVQIDKLMDLIKKYLG